MHFMRTFFELRSLKYFNDESQYWYQKDHVAMLLVMTKIIEEYAQFMKMYYMHHYEQSRLETPNFAMRTIVGIEINYLYSERTKASLA